MPPESGNDPAVWLATAREHLIGVQTTSLPVRLRCFCGQRAVELSLKAVLIHHGIEFPHTHTIERLMLLVPTGTPENIREAAGLTAYAVEEMYPDTFTDLGDEHATEAVEMASAAVEWAATVIQADAPA